MQPDIEDERGNDIGKRANEDGERSSQKSVPEKVGEYLKALAVVGTFSYGALFVGYRAYYRVLGIPPEDVGVSHAFILVRSIGYIVLVACLVILVAIYVLLMRNPKITKRDTLGTIALSMIIGWYIYWLFPRSLLRDVVIFVGVVIAAALLADAIQTGRRRKAWYTGLVITFLLAILLPAAAISWRAQELARKSLDGETVEPITLLGVPLLDVSTDYIHATWICAEAQRPPVFNRFRNNILKGTSLGETSTSFFMLIQRTSAERQNHPNRPSSMIVKFPQNCVMVSRFGNQKPDVD
ncbi:hypothetical protein [Mycobacterium intracellulare]|uniref:hypothetical protein n=1 Tax=Mycobacterium intracellulare TaxID=1767 RepID=UPI001155F274|nr:hypothetical protein [Mycobacterium intracellulare]